MLVLVLLIIAAVLFGADFVFFGFFYGEPNGVSVRSKIVSLGLCLVSIALAVWHAGK